MRINSKTRALLWGIALLITSGLFIRQLIRGVTFETNILDLLPETEENPVLEQAIRTFAEKSGGTLLFLVGHADENKAQQAAQDLSTSLSTSGLFRAVRCQITDADKQAFFDLYFPYRYQILARETRAMLTQANGGEQLTRHAVFALYSPLAAMYSGIMEKDPLLLFPEFLKSIAGKAGKISAADEYITIVEGGMTFILVTAIANDSPYARRAQQAVVEAIKQAEHSLHEHDPTITLRWTGVFRFAEDISRTMHQDMSMIGIGSTLGIVILLLSTFRSCRQLLLCALSISIGLLLAFTFTSLAFPKLHLLTLVFGASLIGVCDDYCVHYFSEQLFSDKSSSPDGILRKIMPGITLGALTSVIGYLSLFLTPFPGLRQMAVFSSLGIVGAYLTVVCWYPVLSGAVPHGSPPLLFIFGQKYLSAWDHFRNSRWSILLMAITAIFIVLGLAKVKLNDDIRMLHNLPAELLDNDQKMRALIGHTESGQFILIEGKSREEVLQLEEQVSERLAGMIDDHQIGGFQGISSFVPSQARQRENWLLLKSNLIDRPTGVMSTLQSAGYSADVIKKLETALTSTPENFLTIDQAITRNPNFPLGYLWLGKLADRYCTMVSLQQVHDNQGLYKLEREFTNIDYVNEGEIYTNLLARHRSLATKLIIGSYAVIAILLMFRYGIKQSALIMLIPVMAALITFAIMGWSGRPINIFHIIALLLVLGMGIDFGIFFAEFEAERQTIMLAVLVSSITSILSFGLLALTANPILQTIGGTIFIGILTCAALVSNNKTQKAKFIINEKS